MTTVCVSVRRARCQQTGSTTPYGRSAEITHARSHLRPPLRSCCIQAFCCLSAISTTTRTTLHACVGPHVHFSDNRMNLPVCCLVCSGSMERRDIYPNRGESLCSYSERFRASDAQALLREAPCNRYIHVCVHAQTTFGNTTQLACMHCIACRCAHLHMRFVLRVETKAFRAHPDAECV